MAVSVANPAAGAAVVAAPNACDDRPRSVLGEDGRGLSSGNDTVQSSGAPVDIMRLLILLVEPALLLRRLLQNRRSVVRCSSHSDPVSRK